MIRNLSLILSIGLLGTVTTPLCAQISVGAVSVFEDINDETSVRPHTAPIRMVAARGGFSSGQVLVSADSPQTSLTVRASDLTGPNGAVIPASRVQIRAGLNTDPHDLGEGLRRTLDDYIILAEAPPASWQRLALYFTVHVPVDAVPGRYAGAVQIAAGGSTHTVRLALDVGGYILPDPKNYRTVSNITYSPDSIALRYGVFPWSEEHLALYQRSLELLRAVGQKVFYVTFIRRTQFGTETPLVRFTRQGERLVPDYGPLERFAAKWDEVIGKPHFISLYLWDVDMRNAHDDDHIDTVNVQVADGDRLEWVEIPHIGNPEGDAFWKPVVDGVIERLVARGWDRDSIFLGIAHDRKPAQSYLNSTSRLFPGMKWNVISHERGYGLPNRPEPRPGLVIGFQENPHAVRRFRDVSESGIIGGWNLEIPRLTIARQYNAGRPWRGMVARMAAEGSTGHHGMPARGPTRIWGDSVPVPRADGNGLRRLVHRNGWVNLLRNTDFFIAPGPDGAIPKTSYQHIMEGVQALEARIAIERVLVDRDLLDRVNPALIREAREAINWRHQFINEMQGTRPTAWTGYDENEFMDQLLKLYNAAGAVTEAAGIEEQR
ncbi:MAG: hypothetical protein JJU29_18890 [Verrucomicrobia bacterium]|nr:hypothetical protein [Verrucomicrobiota bacterium]MCH8512471.1 hypothetical protein [Kiritimatiellia bacterium]